MVIHKITMDDDDDLEALRLAALQTIRPRAAPRRPLSSIPAHRQIEKGPFIRAINNPNLIAIVPTVLPPTTVEPEKPLIVQSPEPVESVEVLSKKKEKDVPQPIVVKKEKVKKQRPEKRETSVKSEPKKEKVKKLDTSSDSLFDLEEDVLDFETESLGEASPEEDTLQLYDSDSDSLERLMEQIEEELSTTPKPSSARVKAKQPCSDAAQKPKVNSDAMNNKIKVENKPLVKAKSPPKPEEDKKELPQTSDNYAERSPLQRHRFSPVRMSPKSSAVDRLSPRRSPFMRRTSPVLRKRSLSPRRRSPSPPRRRSPSPRRRSPSPRKRSLTPRKRSLTPRKRSMSPRKRSLSPRKRSLSPRRRSITPRRLSPLRRRSITPRRRISPRRRTPSPRRRSPTPRRRSPSPRRRSLSPRRRSFSPRKRSISPRKRSMSPRRRSISPWRQSISPWKKSLSPRRRSLTPRKRSLTPNKHSPTLKKRSLSPRKRSASPRPNPLLKRKRGRSPVILKRGKRSPIARRPWNRNKAPASPGSRLTTDSTKVNQKAEIRLVKEDDRRSKIEERDGRLRDKVEPIKEETKVKPAVDEPEQPLDPKLEARKRKFENRSLIEHVNKKIRLKSEAGVQFDTGTIVLEKDEEPRPSMRVKRRRIVLDRQMKLEMKAEAKLNKVKNSSINLKRMSDDNNEAEEEEEEEEEGEVVVPSPKKNKKRSEPVEAFSKEDSKKGSDLRDELSRRRAERLNSKGARIDPMARIVQSALEGAVGKIKSKSKATPSERNQPSSVTEKKSKPKGRRVHVLSAKSSKGEDKKTDLDGKNVGVSLRYRSSSPVRTSGRSILRMNQV